MDKKIQPEDLQNIIVQNQREHSMLMILKLNLVNKMIMIQFKDMMKIFTFMKKITILKARRTQHILF